MNFILTAKHWQIFLMLLLGVILSNFTITAQPLLTDMLAVAGFLILISWPLILGIELYKYLPNRIELGNTLFIINGFIIILLVTAVVILVEERKIALRGLSALPAFYIFYAYFHLHYFPGKLLKIIETRREGSFADYIGYGVLIFFWPIGIWFLQPRINKAVEEHTSVEE